MEQEFADILQATEATEGDVKTPQTKGKKKNFITLEQRLYMYALKDEPLNFSHREIAEMVSENFGIRCTRDNVIFSLGKRKKYEQQAQQITPNLRHKQIRGSHYLKMEQGLGLWIQQQIIKGEQLNRPIMSQKGKALSKKFPIEFDINPEFQCSEGWVDNLIDRQDLKPLLEFQEEKISNRKERSHYISQLKQEILQYGQENVYIYCESGLYYALEPIKVPQDPAIIQQKLAQAKNIKKSTKPKNDTNTNNQNSNSIPNSSTNLNLSTQNNAQGDPNNLDQQNSAVKIEDQLLPNDQLATQANTETQQTYTIPDTKQNRLKVCLGLCVNMAGTQKHKPLFLSYTPKSEINNHKDPQIANFQIDDYVDYQFYKTRWIDNAVFFRHMRKLEDIFRAAGKKVLMLIESNPFHELNQEQLEQFQFIKIWSIPRYLDLKLDLMDNGLVKRFELTYKQKLLYYLIRQADSLRENISKVQTISMIELILCVNKAWEEITQENILNVCRQAGLIKRPQQHSKSMKDDSQPPHPDNDPDNDLDIDPINDAPSQAPRTQPKRRKPVFIDADYQRDEEFLSILLQQYREKFQYFNVQRFGANHKLMSVDEYINLLSEFPEWDYITDSDILALVMLETSLQENSETKQLQYKPPKSWSNKENKQAGLGAQAEGADDGVENANDQMNIENNNSNNHRTPRSNGAIQPRNNGTAGGTATTSTPTAGAATPTPVLKIKVPKNDINIATYEKFIESCQQHSDFLVQSSKQLNNIDYHHLTDIYQAILKEKVYYKECIDELQQRTKQ